MYKIISVPIFTKAQSSGNVFKKPSSIPRKSMTPILPQVSEELVSIFFSSTPISALYIKFLSSVAPIIGDAPSGLVIGDKIGSGAQGTVFSCSISGEPYVMKVVPKESEESLLSEAAFLRLLWLKFPEATWFPKAIKFFQYGESSALVKSRGIVEFK